MRLDRGLATMTAVGHHPADAGEVPTTRIAGRWGPPTGGDAGVSTLDAELVRRAGRGDHGAFEAIVAASIDRLFALALLITRDATLAEDALQDAYARAWRDLPGLRDPDRLSAWLSRLTINATYDLMRRRRRVRQTVPLEVASAVAGDSVDTVDGIVLADAYARLPPEQRAVIVLHYYLGLPLDEVADTLGVPPGTVRSRLHTALRSMRAWLGPGDIPLAALEAHR
jgi:RNA polymerase sigma-70 factor (ECF subfamily)